MEWKTIIMLYRDADGDVACGRRLDSEAPSLDERAEYVTLAEAEAAVERAVATEEKTNRENEALSLFAIASLEKEIDCLRKALWDSQNVSDWDGPARIAAERARILAVVREVKDLYHGNERDSGRANACDEIIRRVEAK